MITTLLRASRIALSRDRVAQTMTFVLPIAFFSIFAMVFGRQSMNNTSRIRVAVVDQDHSASSRAWLAALEQEASLRVIDSVGTGAERKLLDRGRALSLVQAGDVPLAVIVPAGWGATFPNFAGTGMPVDVLSDPSDPIARQIAVGLMQRAGARVMRAGMGAPAQAGAGPDPLALVRSNVTEVVGDRRAGGARMISFYAAGIAVMFLLFSVSSGGGVLLDEQDSGTLERVLNTRVGMNGLLAAKWLHLTLLGVTQITVMFTWGALVFGLDLLGHLPGFVVMTLITAAAAAGFGLLLATLCRTRQQLGGISTLVILTMSALGGSMFPRFLMSEGMQRVGLATFNAWALDGYIKVFWREAPLVALWPQLLVLIGLTVAFLSVARLMARRWEVA
jgi:ABC-2 type transport system permease protein